MSMEKGQRGPGVKMLQQKLDAWIQGVKGTPSDPGLIGVIADGAFGQNTMVALAAYQKFIDVSPTGYADDETLMTLQLPGGLIADGTQVIESSGGGV